MAVGVVMPKAGITVEECVITEWLKKKGDHVNVGDILFTYETDKASFECESTAEGELLEIFYQDGDEVPVLTNVCAIGQSGEDVSALRGGSSEAAPAAPAQTAPAAAPAPAAAEPAKEADGGLALKKDDKEKSMPQSALDQMEELGLSDGVKFKKKSVHAPSPVYTVLAVLTLLLLIATAVITSVQYLNIHESERIGTEIRLPILSDAVK